MRCRSLLSASLFFLTAALAGSACSVEVTGGSTDDDVDDSQDQACGSRGLLACAEGFFCDFAPGTQCGATDQGGTCKPVPEVCADVYDPVCGCDGKTYPNACEAHRAGMSVASEGECEEPEPGEECGGISGQGCAAGEYCRHAPDESCVVADQVGTCEPFPEVCTEEYAPVCGCDGVTYSNECTAAMAGVRVASEGECAPTGKACGGFAQVPCAEGEYCHYEPEGVCGGDDSMGVCAPTPEACDTVYDPVCGCDGKTYSNACMAAMAGVSVASKGECAPAGKTCGGLTGEACGEGEFCDYAPEALCGAADQTGTCKPTPDGCTKEGFPVCGCDGHTYSNPCMAAMAGVSVAKEGECDAPEPGKACGGLAGEACAEGEYCNYAPEDICGAADAMGVCAPTPEACDTVYDPVCGCDGKTYSNACMAAMAGVSVASEGACSKP